ncbi:acetyl-coenzyme A synthetase [Flammeovirgaceae bacterium 311]|nr:acetyl-coenzyme A synthetase [Flammeovirgaceae bacterium 311]
MSNYHIKSLEEYFKIYRKSVREPELFWEEVAEEHFAWRKRWNKVLEWDFSKPEVKWFEGAKLNITENCIDRHLLSKGEQTAIIFEPNNPDEEAQHISYNELFKRVNQFANVLKEHGIKKGDRVCVYLPMIPELAISILACARIGAIHSVVFAGFSSTALATRINDSDCKMVITSDGSYRGAKTIDLKAIVDEALKDCAGIETVLVAKRTNTEVKMKEGRDKWLQPLLDKASAACEPEIMDAEDPLFILYTSGSTGKPKGMVHSTAGYMVFTAYTFKNVFQYRNGDVYWCTADIGWITGHSYIVYGPLANGATTVMFEGVPNYPDFSRFWNIIEKHKVNQFYTAPTAIRSLAKESLSYLEKHDLSSLKVLGSVGEPINEEAWHWYNDNVGNHKSPIVDTWWQTETGGIMISPIPYVTPTIPTFATMPLPGVQLALMSEGGEELTGNLVEGRLCITFPWPAIARTIWGNHQRFKDTYFSTYENKYFTGDGARRDAVGYYRITGRVDDVIIVSGHNLGTAPIEDAINEHPAVAESAIVGCPHDIKGNALYGFITLKETGESRVQANLRKEINQIITEHIGPIAKLDTIQFTTGLPKTRSGKIMRRILRKIACKDTSNLGDISTLQDPEIVQQIIDESAAIQ